MRCSRQPTGPNQAHDNPAAFMLYTAWLNNGGFRCEHIAAEACSCCTGGLGRLVNLETGPSRVL